MGADAAPAFADTATGRFAYLAAGPAAGGLVVCLHGFPDHPASFQPLLAVLGAAGYRAVAPWMRGYVPSMREGPYHAEQLADDALAVGRALAGGRRFALVGHDWGAVATWLACSHRPADLACAVTMAVPHPLAFLHNLSRQPAQLRRSWYALFFQVPGLPEWLVPRRDFALVDRLWRDWSPGFTLDEVSRRRLHQCLAESMPAPIEYYRAVAWPPSQAAARMRAVGQPDRLIRTPVLHLHGADDGCVDPAAARGQRRFVTGPFECELVPRVGHFLQLEDPAEVGRRTLRWLRMYFPPLGSASVPVGSP